MAEKKSVLVLVDWFAPGYKAGGPIQSCLNFAFTMKDELDIKVLTTDTDHGETTPYEGIPTGQWISNLHPSFQVLYLKKATLSNADIKYQLVQTNADYIYLNHLFSPRFVIYPLWLKATGRLKSEIVVCPRGALYDSALAVKTWKKTPFLTLFKWMRIHKKILFHATNHREKAAIERFFPGSRILIADNLPKFDQLPFVSTPKTRGKLKCIFIARIVPIKNLLFLMQALEQVQKDNHIELTVIGPVEDDAYWAKCLLLASRFQENIRMDYLGPVKNDELIPLLHQHHLFVLPTTGENFGHSIFEALLAGRPVLISDQTPWLGMASRQTGWDLPLDDTAAFTRAIEEAAGWDQPQFERSARSAWQFAGDFVHNSEFQRQYLRLFA